MYAQWIPAIELGISRRKNPLIWIHYKSCQSILSHYFPFFLLCGLPSFEPGAADGGQVLYVLVMSPERRVGIKEILIILVPFPQWLCSIKKWQDKYLALLLFLTTWKQQLMYARWIPSIEIPSKYRLKKWLVTRFRGKKHPYIWLTLVNRSIIHYCLWTYIIKVCHFNRPNSRIKEKYAISITPPPPHSWTNFFYCMSFRTK